MVDVATIGALLGGGGQFLGGLSSLFGGGSGREIDPVQFATSQIQWRVADAKAAGIHPLYAMGLQPSYPSPSYVGGSDVGSGLANMGQGLARAGEALATKDERMLSAAQALALERGELENQLLRAQIALTQQAGTPPAFPDLGVGETWAPRGSPIGKVTTAPLAGQGDAQGLVKLEPSKSVSAAVGLPGMEAAANPDIRWFRSNRGGFVAMPSSEMKIDDASAPGYLGWMLRNRIAPAMPLAPRHPPPDSMLPKGAVGWVYDPTEAEWYPVNPDGGFIYSTRNYNPYYQGRR